MTLSKTKTPPKPTKPKRELLSADRIVLASIALIDENGIAGFSMRKLGRSLGVEAMSLYDYFESKEALLLGVRSFFYKKLDLPTVEGALWYEQMRATMTATYDLGVAHPSYIAVHIHVPIVPESRQRGERDRALLLAAGFTREEASGAMVALVSYVIGFLHRMVLANPVHDPTDTPDRDRAFQLGLSAILEGLRALQAKPAL